MPSDTVSFIKRKISLLCPNYYVAWIIAFFVKELTGHNSCLIILKHSVQAVPELLFIGNAGFAWRYYNGATWYISVMLLSMAIIYPFARKYKKTFFYIAAPLLFLFLMGSLFQRFGMLTRSGKWNGFYNKDFVRGFSEILAGCVCYDISRWLRRFNFTNLARTVFCFVEYAMFAATIAYMYYHKASKYDFIVVFAFMLIIVISLSNISFDSLIFKHKVFIWLGAFSLDLYLGHGFWRANFKLLFTNINDFRSRMLIYLLLVFATALFIMYFSKFLKHFWEKARFFVRKLLIC